MSLSSSTVRRGWASAIFFFSLGWEATTWWRSFGTQSLLYTRYVQELPPCRPSRQTLLLAMVNEPWMIDQFPCVPFSPPLPTTWGVQVNYRNRLHLHKHTAFILFRAPKRIRKKQRTPTTLPRTKILVPDAEKNLQNKTCVTKARSVP